MKVSLGLSEVVRVAGFIESLRGAVIGKTQTCSSSHYKDRRTTMSSLQGLIDLSPRKYNNLFLK